MRRYAACRKEQMYDVARSSFVDKKKVDVRSVCKGSAFNVVQYDVHMPGYLRFFVEMYSNLRILVENLHVLSQVSSAFLGSQCCEVMEV